MFIREETHEDDDVLNQTFDDWIPYLVSTQELGCYQHDDERLPFMREIQFIKIPIRPNIMEFHNISERFYRKVTLINLNEVAEGGILGCAVEDLLRRTIKRTKVSCPSRGHMNIRGW